MPAILMTVQAPPLSQKCVTLVLVKGGVVGHHGALVLCLVVLD